MKLVSSFTVFDAAREGWAVSWTLAGYDNPATVVAAIARALPRGRGKAALRRHRQQVLEAIRALPGFGMPRRYTEFQYREMLRSV